MDSIEFSYKSDKTRVNKYGYEQWNIDKEERIIHKIKQAEI
ncbi:MAG: hypothetical protein WCC17_08900 [Candidatus Nitrosopolaris sp.]